MATSSSQISTITSSRCGAPTSNCVEADVGLDLERFQEDARRPDLKLLRNQALELRSVHLPQELDVAVKAEEAMRRNR